MRFIRRREVINKTGLSYPTIWRRMREGAFRPAIQSVRTPSPGARTKSTGGARRVPGAPYQKHTT